jgi:hypothetical protein
MNKYKMLLNKKFMEKWGLKEPIGVERDIISLVFIRYKKNNKHYIQVNEKLYGPYDYIWDLELSSDGLKYGWSYKKNNQWYVQLNDKIYGPYDDVYLTFIKDDKTIIAYIQGDEVIVEKIK